eukprot:5011164-Lingulodinium_polyedra.AAC.1
MLGLIGRVAQVVKFARYAAVAMLAQEGALLSARGALVCAVVSSGNRESPIARKRARSSLRAVAA